MNSNAVWPSSTQWLRGADGGISVCAKPFLEMEKCIMSEATDNRVDCVEYYRIYKECLRPRFTVRFVLVYLTRRLPSDLVF